MEPALVAGNGLTALGVMRSLGRAGIPFYNLNRQTDFVASSRWYRPPPREWGTLEDDEPLAPYLARLPLPRAVLFAGSDDRVREAAQLDDTLRARFPASIAPSDTIHALLDKLSLARLLAARDLPHPRTFDLETDNDLDAVPDAVFANAFLKPRDSLSFVRRYNTKGFRVASREEARALLRKLRADAVEVILQEYIPGDASRHYFVDGFVDRHGDFRGWFARRRLRMYPVDFGNSSAMVSIELDEVAGAIDALRRLLPDLSYRGIFSAEFKLDPRDDRFKLIEVNCRPWWFNGFAADCGVDVTLMAYHDALGDPVTPSNGYKRGARLVLSVNDLRACLHLHRTAELNLAESMKFWLAAHDAVFKWNDPMPFVRHSWTQVARIGRALLKGRAAKTP
jgi:D-aspartate ligase